MDKERSGSSIVGGGMCVVCVGVVLVPRDGSPEGKRLSFFFLFVFVCVSSIFVFFSSRACAKIACHPSTSLSLTQTLSENDQVFPSHITRLGIGVKTDIF